MWLKAFNPDNVIDLNANEVTYTDFVNKETELVVIVTPYVVRPTAKKNLAAPTDGLAPATDVRTYLLGHLNRIHGRSVSLPGGSLKDGYGFIVE